MISTIPTGAPYQSDNVETIPKTVRQTKQKITQSQDCSLPSTSSLALFEFPLHSPCCTHAIYSFVKDLG